MSLTKLSLSGNNWIVPVTEILVSDIRAGDGKTANLFLQCNDGQFLDQPYFSLLSTFKQHYFEEDSLRPIFNWVHSLLGISILILGWVSALLATQLTDKVNHLF